MAGTAASLRLKAATRLSLSASRWRIKDQSSDAVVPPRSRWRSVDAAVDDESPPLTFLSVDDEDERDGRGLDDVLEGDDDVLAAAYAATSPWPSRSRAVVARSRCEEPLLPFASSPLRLMSPCKERSSSAMCNKLPLCLFYAFFTMSPVCLVVIGFVLCWGVIDDCAQRGGCEGGGGKSFHQSTGQ